jgi:hypothetical protein
MPIYCFSSEDGEVIEEFFSMGDAPSELHRLGKQYLRDFSAELPSRRSCSWEPIECIASGVHSSQAGELRDFFKKHGESVTVTADGNPVYTSAGQRKRLLKLRGLHDRNSY